MFENVQKNKAKVKRKFRKTKLKLRLNFIQSVNSSTLSYDTAEFLIVRLLASGEIPNKTKIPTFVLYAQRF